MLIRDILAVPHVEGIYGLEIEVEGQTLPTRIKGWRCDRDPSLKAEESIEYVFNNPGNLAETRIWLDNLDEAFTKMGSRVDDAFRAGVHVHMNVQAMTAKELFTLIVIYLILEDLLVEWCGEYRSGNHFCLRAQDAEHIIFKWVECIKKQEFLVFNDNYRYASLNPMALLKYGSIEFRSMRSTRDLNLIYRWVLILDRIKTISKNYNDPQEVILSLSGFGFENFAKEILGEFYEDFKNIPNVYQKVKEGMRRAQPLAFAREWDNNTPVINPFNKRVNW